MLQLEPGVVYFPVGFAFENTVFHQLKRITSGCPPSTNPLVFSNTSTQPISHPGSCERPRAESRSFRPCRPARCFSIVAVVRWQDRFERNPETSRPVHARTRIGRHCSIE